MRLFRPCLLLLLPAALSAQTAVLRVLMSRDALDIPTPATLLVFDTKGDHSLSQGFATLLSQPELKALQVPMQGHPVGSAEWKAWSLRLHLEAKPLWLLVAKGDTVLAKGSLLPTVVAYTQELANAGFRDRVKELRAYLKAHPESLEAQERLIGLLRQRGEVTAQRFMGLDVAGPLARLEQGDLAGYLRAADALPQADLSEAAALTPAQDLEAWSAFAQELDQAFRSGAWRELDLAFAREGRPLDSASPTLQNLYRRARPEVEAALRLEPGSEALWDLWVWLSQGRGEAGLRHLLGSLKPSPFASKGQWPPDRALRMLFATARTPEDWRVLREHFQDRWDGAPHMLRDRPPEGPASWGMGTTTNDALLEREWASTLEPLLESTLRCGDAARADGLVKDVLAASHWSALPAKAATVANRCGQGTLATRWSALHPVGQK